MSEKNPNVFVRLHDGPLPPVRCGDSCCGGAWVCFEGIVRPTEDGKPIAGLMYEAYRPMADRQLLSLGEELVRTHQLLGARVEHSVGWVPAGACSFRLEVAAPRRKEAFVAMEEFIDRMKRDVPIWKSARAEAP